MKLIVGQDHDSRMTLKLLLALSLIAFDHVARSATDSDTRKKHHDM